MCTLKYDILKIYDIFQSQKIEQQIFLSKSGFINETLGYLMAKGNINVSFLNFKCFFIQMHKK